MDPALPRPAATVVDSVRPWSADGQTAKSAGDERLAGFDEGLEANTILVGP